MTERSDTPEGRMTVKEAAERVAAFADHRALENIRTDYSAPWREAMKVCAEAAKALSEKRTFNDGLEAAAKVCDDWPTHAAKVWELSDKIRALKNAAHPDDGKTVSPGTETPEYAAAAPISPSPKTDEVMVSVPLSAVKLAWSIAKERRDELFQQANLFDIAEKELEQLSAAGFDAHLPTIMDLRGILKDTPGERDGT